MLTDHFCNVKRESHIFHKMKKIYHTITEKENVKNEKNEKGEVRESRAIKERQKNIFLL